MTKTTINMWIIRISLTLYGDRFSPKKLLKEIIETFHTFSSNEPNDLNDRDPEGIFGFGSLSILSPQLYALDYEMTEYEKWYFDFIDTYKSIFDQNGITQINLFIEIFHNGGQLNFEIFSRELLKKVGFYNIAIPISYYRLTTEQIVDMLSETGISAENLQHYIEIG